jgi:hypothetical protein
VLGEGGGGLLAAALLAMLFVNTKRREPEEPLTVWRCDTTTVTHTTAAVAFTNLKTMNHHCGSSLNELLQQCATAIAT